MNSTEEMLQFHLGVFRSGPSCPFIRSPSWSGEAHTQAQTFLLCGKVTPSLPWMGSWKLASPGSPGSSHPTHSVTGTWGAISRRYMGVCGGWPGGDNDKQNQTTMSSWKVRRVKAFYKLKVSGICLLLSPRWDEAAEKGAPSADTCCL